MVLGTLIPDTARRRPTGPLGATNNPLSTQKSSGFRYSNSHYRPETAHWPAGGSQQPANTRQSSGFRYSNSHYCAKTAH